MPRDLQVELENISRANWATSSSKRPSIQSPISPGSALTSPTHTHADPPLSATSTMAPISASPSLAPSTAPASAMSPASTAGTGATSGSGQPVLVPGPANDIEQRVREHMNRARVWLVCFNLDRSLSTQFGRPNTVLVNFPGARTWYLSAGGARALVWVPRGCDVLMHLLQRMAVGTTLTTSQAARSLKS